MQPTTTEDLTPEQLGIEVVVFLPESFQSEDVTSRASLKDQSLIQRALDRLPILGRAELAVLSTLALEGNLEARNKIVLHNLRLALSFSKRHLQATTSLLREGALSGFDLDDLIQEAVIGLMTAAQKWDHRRNIRFSTYAVPWVQQTMKRFIENCGSAIRVPVAAQEQRRLLLKEVRRHSQQFERNPTVGELTQCLAWPTDKVIRTLHDTCRVVVDLYSPVMGTASDTLSLYDTLIDSSLQPEERLLAIEEVAVAMFRLQEIATKVRSIELNDRERHILYKKLGFYDNMKTQSLKEIAREMGVSGQRVQQVMGRIVAKLRSALGEDDWIIWNALEMGMHNSELHDNPFRQNLAKMILAQ